MLTSKPAYGMLAAMLQWRETGWPSDCRDAGETLGAYADLQRDSNVSS